MSALKYKTPMFQEFRTCLFDNSFISYTHITMGLCIAMLNFLKMNCFRAYITPYKRFKIKLQSNLNCHICNTTSSGTFLHMFWECPVVISLWTHVNLVLSSLLRIDWSVNPSLKIITVFSKALLDSSVSCHSYANI